MTEERSLSFDSPYLATARPLPNPMVVVRDGYGRRVRDRQAAQR
jgi:hypothetical protein